jgi:hypothetical protein
MSSATSSSHDSATGCGDSQHTRSGDIPAHWPRRPLAAPRNPEKLRGVTLRMNAMYKLVAVTAVVAALTILSASTPGGRPSTEPPCSSAVRKGPLPIWARGGFHPSTQRIPHVLGRSGALVAILFSYPLNASPPARHPANKILWKPRLSWNTPTNLRISAQRMKGTRLAASQSGGSSRAARVPLSSTCRRVAGACRSTGRVAPTVSTFSIDRALSQPQIFGWPAAF